MLVTMEKYLRLPVYLSLLKRIFIIHWIFNYFGIEYDFDFVLKTFLQLSFPWKDQGKLIRGRGSMFNPSSVGN